MKKLSSILLALTMLLTLTAGLTFSSSAAVGEVKTSGDFTYQICEDGTAMLTKYNGTAVDVTVPAQLDGVNVTKLQGTFLKTNVQKVTIPEGVLWIGGSAFEDCSALEEVVIPNSAERILAFAFRSCEKLKALSIPDGVVMIDDTAFWGCTSISEITVSAGNAYFASQNGVLFNKAMSKLLIYPAAKSAKSYTVPQSVVAIADNAFASCSKLQTLKLKANVKSIHPFAISNCTALKKIAVDGKNKKYCAKDGVLYNKKKTELVCYPAAKSGKSFTCPKSVKTINATAFTGCKNLTVLKLSKNVKSITFDSGRTKPFSGCNKLKKVYYGGSKANWKKIYYYETDAADGSRTKVTYEQCGKGIGKKYRNGKYLKYLMNDATVYYNAKV